MALPESKQDFSADIRRCTQNTQMVSCNSQCIDHRALISSARLAEIQQQAELEAGRSGVVRALHPVHVIQLLNRFK